MIYTTPVGMIRNFGTQFEEDGHGGYIYRLRGTGKPIPVSDGERRRFIAQYGSRLLLIYGLMIAAGLAFFFIFFWGAVRSSRFLPSSVILSDPFLYAGLGVILLPASFLMYWLEEAPARALKGRAALGPEPTRDEVRGIFFHQISYGGLALLALAGVASFASIARRDLDWRWVAVPILIVLVAAAQAFRKWRFERRHPDLR